MCKILGAEKQNTQRFTDRQQIDYYCNHKVFLAIGLLHIPNLKLWPKACIIIHNYIVHTQEVFIPKTRKQEKHTQCLTLTAGPHDTFPELEHT